jgi:predicted  nucleic acid-binding Zn-ribbon protein
VATLSTCKAEDQQHVCALQNRITTLQADTQSQQHTITAADTRTTALAHQATAVQDAVEGAQQADVRAGVVSAEALAAAEAGLAAAQQQVLHAVKSVRTELQGHQQHALVEDMTVSK